MKNYSTTIYGFIAFVIVIGASLYFYNQSQQPGQYDTLAQCLKDKGVVFYGAFWCPHCQAQKKAFGNSAELLPYQECSSADGNGQLKVCTDAKVESYPTWVFPDGSRLTGEVPLTTLAEKTGCPLSASSTSPSQTTSSSSEQVSSSTTIPSKPLPKAPSVSQ